MGTESIWVPLVMSAVAAGASVYNTQRTERKQDQALAQQLRGQAERQRQADSKVAELIADQAQSTPDDERTMAANNYRKALLAAKSNAEGGLGGMPGASDAFKESSAQAKTGIAEYGDKIAGLLSTIDAPYMQRQNEQFAQNRHGDGLGLLSRFDQGQTWLDQLRLQSIRPNPWLNAASQALGGYASASAGGRGG